MFQEVYPQSQKATYNPNDNVSFYIKIPSNREIKKNSFAISGVLKATLFNTTTNAFIPINITTNIAKYCCEAGVHSFFENFTTMIDDMSIPETLIEYGRFVEMYEQNNSNDNERHCLTVHNQELKCAGDEDSTLFLMGTDYGTPANYTPFCFKPMIAINRTDKNLRSDKFQTIRITFNLADPTVAMYTTGLGNTILRGYTISNLKLTYIANDLSDESAGAIRMKTTNCIKYRLASNVSNLEFVLPSTTNGLVSSVALTTSLAVNNKAIDYIPINLLRYSFNDSNNQLVSFDLKNDAEILHLYTQTLKDRKDSENVDTLVPLPPSASNQDFGFGMSLMKMPANNKVTMMIQSNADSVNNTYQLFTYLLGEVTL